jgi:hypothetical protein
VFWFPCSPNRLAASRHTSPRWVWSPSSMPPWYACDSATSSG